MRQTGKIIYRYSCSKNGHGSEDVVLSLTLVADDDEKALQSGGIRHLRLRRIARLTREASEHGVLLGYEDLSMLLLTSLATLKRDISSLEARGLEVLLRGRRKKKVNKAYEPHAPIQSKNAGLHRDPVHGRHPVLQERVA